MDSLSEILDVERDIAQRLEGERAKAAAWLAEKKRALEQPAQSEIDRLERAAAEDQASLRQAAEERSAEIARRATVLAERIRRIDDDHLARIVWDHLQRIVPGLDRDRQDVQN